jgi:ornithine carbamoyltransferase
MLDLSTEDLSELLNTSLAIKRDGCGPELSGQILALVFEKPSLRTRVAFEVAMHRLGGRALYLGQYEVGAGEREPVRDVARVLARMVQGIAARTYSHSTVTEFARWSDVPVVNALSSEEHPCQALADLLTLFERFGSLRGLRLAYLGEGNNVARSLAIGAVLAGMEFRCASPEGYGLSEADLAMARAAGGDGAVIQIEDPQEAVQDAAAVYTDVWASMGEEHKLSSRVEAFRPFRLNGELLAAAPPDALIMHDLPAHRGEEISDEAIESPQSIVFDQAENRVHTQQAVLLSLLGSGE